MTVTTSRWAAVVDDLVAAAAAALPNVYVHDGPPLGETGQDQPTRLWIGAGSADPNVGGLAVDTLQAWRNTRGMTREETVLVHCIAEGWSASANMKAARDLAVAAVAAVEVLLRPTPTTVATYGGSLFGELIDSQPEQYQMAAGAFCRIPFTLSFASYLNQV